MHRQHLIGPALWDLLDAQAGVVSREQALIHLPARSIQRYLNEGLWTSLAHGVYAARPPLWESWAWAGVLLGGPAAVVGGAAALRLHGVLDADPALIHIYSPRRVSAPLPLRCIRARRPGRGALPREGVEDALLDTWPRMGERDFLVVLGRACQRGLTSPTRLAETLTERPRLPRRAALRAILTESADGVHSPLERDYRRDVERAHSLPTPERQARLGGAIADILYRRWGVVIELDGRLGHESGRFRDMARDNRHTGYGLLTLRFGWADVHERPCEVAREVARALRSRGWTGILRPCHRCGRVPGSD